MYRRSRKYREVDERGPGPPGAEGERGAAPEEDAGRGEDGRREVPDVAAHADYVEERAQGGREEHGAGDVERPVEPGSPVGRQDDPAQEHGRDPDRDVQEEDPLPPGVLAEDPPSAGPTTAPTETAPASSPKARRRAPPATWIMIIAPPIAWSMAAPTPWTRRKPDQEPDPGREAAEEGGDREDAEPRQVDPAKAVPVRERAEEDQGRGQGDPVGEADPG